MPRAAPERAASERWIDELATLMAGGATRRFIVRAAELQIVEDRHGFLSTRAEPGIWTTGTVVLRYAEVSLYRLDADAGDLPTAVAPFPVEVIDGLGDEVDVRGRAAPGTASSCWSTMSRSGASDRPCRPRPSGVAVPTVSAADGAWG